jgi:hypothetical protein
MSYYKQYLEYKLKYEKLLKQYPIIVTYNFPSYNYNTEMKLYFDRNKKPISNKDYIELEKNKFYKPP